MIWWIIGGLALLLGLLALRDLARSPHAPEPPASDLVRDDRHGHHGREAEGWNVQPPGGHSGGAL